MSEPYGNKWKQYTVYPKLTNQSGGTVDKIKLNIGEAIGPVGATGATGIGIDGATGATGPSGNPNMQLTSPNGAIYQIVVDNTGQLGTTLISAPPAGPEGPSLG